MSAAFNWRFFFLSATVLLLVSLVGYHNVLFNFFCGDDFVHLSWLHRAQSQPDLLWQNFHSNWLEVPTTKFYRPLISVFMFTDYALWKTNGLGFHLTNLAFHFLSSLFLCLTLIEIASLASLKNDATFDSKVWALGAAVLFALFPLHPEAVSWITGRVDSVVTAFCLASTWCYLRWRDTNSILYLIFSLLTFSCGLASKEMAVTIPVLVLFIDLLFKKRSFASATFWLVLVAYFILRKFALGTFIGGYDNSLLAEGNPFSFVLPFIRSMGELIVPINKDLFVQGRVVALFWSLLTVFLFLSTLRSISNQHVRLAAFFLLGWFFLALAPVYKLFNIASDLETSRLAYLASAPYCALLFLGISQRWQKKIDRIRYLFAAVTLLFAGCLLIGNNRSWQVSGEQTSAMLKSFDALSRQENVDAPTYIAGMPDNYHGAYMCRNAIEGMTQFPQIYRDMPHCFRLDNFDPVFPFGFAKDTIQSDPHSRILRWQFNEKKLVPISLKGDRYFQETWSGSQLQSIIENPLLDKFPVYNWVFKLQIPCWQSELISFTLSPLNELDPNKITLYYANSLIEVFEPRHRLPPFIQANESGTTVSFCLRGETDWALGDGQTHFRLKLPKDAEATIKKIAIRNPSELMPIAHIHPASNQNVNGYLELNPKFNRVEIFSDISQMEHAKSVDLEISKPNRFFQVHNDPERSEDVGQTRTGSSDAKITLRLEDFPQDGIYHVRLRATDRTGQPIGFAGDNIVLTVHH